MPTRVVQLFGTTKVKENRRQGPSWMLARSGSLDRTRGLEANHVARLQYGALDLCINILHVRHHGQFRWSSRLGE